MKIVTLIRVAYGLISLLCFASLKPFLGLFYGADGICMDSSFSWLGPAWVKALWAAALVNSILLVWGRWLRVSLVLQYLLIGASFHYSCRAGNYGDQIFASTAFLMMFLPAGRGEKVKWWRVTMTLFASTLYVAPLILRLSGKSWWNGTALWFALADPTTSFVWEPLLSHPKAVPAWVFLAATYLSLLYEAAFPALIWFRKFRVPLVTLGVVFHLAMGSVMELGLFPLQMALVLAATLLTPSIPATPSPHPRA